MNKLILFIILISYASIVFGETLVVRHVNTESSNDQRDKYFIDLLRLALEKTENKDGSFRLEIAEKRMYQERTIYELEQNKGIDVLWTMTSKEREKRIKPIRIPLLKGLLGHRIFIIRKADQPIFSAIQTLPDLQKLLVGQGSHWPDTKILRANGFKVIGSPGYDGLFSMLQHDRFDFFPRGVNEPWEEVKTHKDKNLAIEQTLMLQYPAPIYFFVNNRNVKLAERLERGLRIAMKDGSFDRLFMSHPSHVEIFELANMENRKLFRLKNPLLTPETPLNEKKFWYNPASISK